MNPLVTIGLIGGALFLAKGAKKKTAAPLPAPAPDAPAPLPDVTVSFDVYPASASAEGLIPATDTSVTHSPDCSVIVVADGWWEGVARPFVETHEGVSTDLALELVINTLSCDEDTDALDEFLADVDSAIQAWRQVAFAPGPDAPLPHPEVPEVPGMGLGFDPTTTPEGGAPKATIGD